MATTERPPVKIDGKRNPAYDEWYRAQKKSKQGYRELAEEMVEGMKPEVIDEFIANCNSLSETLSLRVMGFLPNRSFVECDNNGHRLTVKVDPRYRDRLLKKTITVRREEDGTYSQVP